MICNEWFVAIIVAAIGLIGVIIGAVITFLFQLCVEKRREENKDKKCFLKNALKAYENISICKQALEQAVSFLMKDMTLYSDDAFKKELYPSILNFPRKCSNIWKDFRVDLLKYFYKTFTNDDFIILDNAICIIIRMKPDSDFVKPEMFREKHNDMKKFKDDFDKALIVINSIEEEYNNRRMRFLKCSSKKKNKDDLHYV